MRGLYKLRNKHLFGNPLSMLTSYAQNFEDVMLCRALGSVTQGKYIDIGAQDPTLDSVSKFFHESGWQGVHVEPHPAYAEQLRGARPGDLVLQVAVGAKAGLMSFFAFSGTGLSTLSEEIASRHGLAGFSSETIIVPCITLDDVFENCDFDEVHWLKLDVEGFEKSALAGWKRSHIRPWIIVVEAIEPGGKADISAGYENFLFSKGYHSVYFDGLNKYYVSDLHPELDEHFRYGPCLWDEIQAPRQNRMARTLVEDFDAELKILSDAEDASERALASAKQAESELADARDALQNEYTELSGAYDALQLNLAGQQEQVAEAHAALSAVRAQLEQSIADNSQLADARDALQNEYTELSGAYDALQLNLAGQQEQVAEAHAALSAVRAQLEQSIADNSQLIAALNEACGNNQHLSDRLADQIMAAGWANVRAEESASALQAVILELGAARVTREKLETILAQDRDTLRQAQADLSSARYEVAESSKLLADAALRIEALTSDCSMLEVNLREAHERLEAKTAEADAQADESLQQIIELQSKIEHISSDFDAVSSERRELINRLVLQEEESRSLKSDLEQTQRQVSDREGRLSELIGSLEALASAARGAKGASLRRLLASLPRSKVISRQSDEFVARSVDELILVGEVQFIEACYRTLLGRRADRAGITYYLDRLARGVSRSSIIADIVRSHESITFSPLTPGLPRLLGRQRLLGFQLKGRLARLIGSRRTYRSATAVDAEEDGRANGSLSLKAVLGETGEDFIRQAYELVLQRDPDPCGLEHFLARLSGGDERLDILASMRWSAEGQSLKYHEKDLKQATAWYRMRKWPLIGSMRRQKAIRRLMGGDNQRQRVLQARLDELEIALNEQNASEAEFIGRPIHLKADLDGAQQSAANLLDNVLAELGCSLTEDGSVPVKILGNLENVGDAQVWYVDREIADGLLPLQRLPRTLEVVACGDLETEKILIGKGLGVAVRAIGPVSGPSNFTTGVRLLQLVHDKGRSRERRHRLALHEPLKISVLTTWNTRCGIATHSKELIESFAGSTFEILAPLANDLLFPDQDNVFRLWQVSKSSNQLDKVLTHLRSHQTDLLIVQYNFGFFNHPQLADFLEQATLLGVTVYVIFHSTTEPPLGNGWRLSEIVPGLIHCGLVVVHTPADLAVFASLGLADNVLLLPHGVKPGNTERVHKNLGSVPVLTSFGFCLPNKGLVELVRSVAILRERNVQVRLRMFNALHPDPSSLETMQSVKDEIANLLLDDVVEFFPEFLNLDEVDKEIASSDLFVNPYQKTGESASGAVRLGLRNKVPTVVTPLPIFDDLGDAVFRMAGTSPEEMANGIAETLRSLSDPSTAKAQAAAIDQWLVTHDFRTQASRLDRICRTLRINALMKAR